MSEDQLLLPELQVSDDVLKGDALEYELTESQGLFRIMQGLMKSQSAALNVLMTVESSFSQGKVLPLG